MTLERVDSTTDLNTSDLQFFLGKLKKYPLINHQKELELATIIQNKKTGWKQAREELFLANMRLVVSVAKRFSNQKTPVVDLIQEGMFGLFRACEKFDPNKKIKFSTYATFWVKQSMIRHLHNNVRLIRLPVNISEQVRQVNNFITDYNKLNGKDPSIDELMVNFKLPKHKIENILRSMKIEPKSLNDLVKPDSNIEEFITENDYKVNDNTEVSLLKCDIDLVLNILTKTELYVICSRFGLNKHIYKTLDDLSYELNCCRERVRQIELNACKKLKNNPKSKELIEYLK